MVFATSKASDNKKIKIINCRRSQAKFQTALILQNSLKYIIDDLFYIKFIQNSFKNAVGWSAVYDCGMAWSCSLIVCYVFG